MKKTVFLLAACLLSKHSFSQNIGIGTSNPTRAKFEVEGAVDATSAIFGGESSGISLQRNWPAIGFNTYWNAGNRNLANGYAAKQFLDPGSGFLYVDMLSYTSAGGLSPVTNRAFAISPTGKIALAGASPNGHLQFPNTGINRKIVLWETANNDHQFYGFGIEGGGLRYAVDGIGSAHRFYTGTGSASSLFLMSINGNKKVLIGGQEWGSKLGINSGDPLYTIEMVQAGNKGMGFINPLNGYHFWEIKSEAYSLSVSDALMFYMDGSTTPKGWFRPTDGGYSANSDIRLKTGITEMGSILPKLLQLKPSIYHFKNDVTRQNCIGFIAQDVKKLFPELVDVHQTEDKEIPDLHGMNYGGFGVIAIRAIQEQQEQLQLLQKENVEIKKELAALKKIVEMMIASDKGSK
jgi:hypothetical protein